MTRKYLTTVAATAIFATASVCAPAAFAQSATQPSATAPAATTTAPSSTAPAMTPAPSATAPSTTASADTKTGSYLTQQSPEQVSANTYIGQSVYNGNNESIGKVNDLIMEKQGGIVAAVVGVGGFLGIGEKNVAVPISNVNIAQNTDGTVKLTTSESVDSLKAAPEFKTLEMQSAEKAPSTTPGAATTTDNTSTGSTTSN